MTLINLCCHWRIERNECKTIKFPSDPKSSKKSLNLTQLREKILTDLLNAKIIPTAVEQNEKGTKFQKINDKEIM